MPWTVEFYRSARGESPVEEFLNGLDPRARAKCVSYMELLQATGRLPRQYCAHVDEDLWELRPEYGGVEYRLFYFLSRDQRIVFVHAVSKKTRRLSKRDVSVAMSRVRELPERER